MPAAAAAAGVAADSLSDFDWAATNLPSAAPELEKRDTETVINYIKPDYGGAVQPDWGSAREVHMKEREKLMEVKPVTVLDGRFLPDGGLESLGFDTHGLKFLSGLPEPPEDAFGSKRQTNQEWLPMIAAQTQQATGAEIVVPFSFLTRHEDQIDSTHVGGNYARFAHADYGPEAPPVARRVLVEMGPKMSPEEAENYEVCFVNLWTPVHHPAYKDPFCLLDATTVPIEAARETTTTKIGETIMAYTPMPSDKTNIAAGIKDEFRKPLERFYRRSYFVKYRPDDEPEQPSDNLLIAAKFDPNHRWIFCPDMCPGQAWLFKQWDSRTDVARCSFHTAFTDPKHEEDPTKPGRRSLEVRMCCAFPKKNAEKAGTPGASKL